MSLRSLSVAVFGAALAMGAGLGSAAAIPVEVDCSSITVVQTYNVGEAATDHAYLLMSGMADGKAIEGRFPKTGAWTAAAKQPPIDPKSPVDMWKGQLDNGQSAVLRVVLMQG